MKKIARLILPLFSVFALFATACIEQPDQTPTGSQGLKYKTYKNETYCVVSGIGDCTDYDVEIPSTYNGLNVVGIADEAFKNCDNLTSIKIPEGVKEIGANAFEGCAEMEKIYLPESLEFIGLDALKDCDKLKYNTYNNGKYLGGMSGKYVALIDVIDNEAQDFSINLRTKIIYQSAFFLCESLTELTIPNGVVGIGRLAFAHCTSLPSLVLPESVKTVGLQAFLCCESLTEVTLPSSIETFGQYVFASCDALALINYTGTIEQWNDLENTEHLGFNANKPTVRCSNGEFVHTTH